MHADAVEGSSPVFGVVMSVPVAPCVDLEAELGRAGRFTRQYDRLMSRQLPWSRNLGGMTAGGSVRVSLTPRLWIAPDLRSDYGSIGDEISNTWRSTVRVGVVF